MAEITIVEITAFEDLIIEVPGSVTVEDLGIFDETFDATFE
jgi:hypothetical protein